MRDVPPAPDTRPSWRQLAAGPWTAFRRLPWWGQTIGWLVGFWVLPATWVFARAKSSRGVIAGVVTAVLGLAVVATTAGGGLTQTDDPVVGLQAAPDPTVVGPAPTPSSSAWTSPNPSLPPSPQPATTPDPSTPPTPTPPTPTPAATSVPPPTATTAPAIGDEAGSALPEGGETTTVERIVDGDTLYLAGFPERARLIGIDTPETVAPGRPIECYGPEASAHLAELVPPGTEVVVTRDVELVDRYDRPLVYLYRASDGLFVNEAMLADGYAQLLTYPPNVHHVDTFQQAQRRAREAADGLWGPVCASDGVVDDQQAVTGGSTSSGGAGVVIAQVNWDGPGRDVEFNTSEHVVLRNDGDAAVDVGGWSLTDEVDHRIVIPDGYMIPPGGELRVHAGPGDQTEDAYHAGEEQAIWNNSGGDTATLRDAGGNVVDEQPYSS